MLKRKILAAVLPVVAAATVVGSGFSAWYFGTLTGSAQSGKIGVSITDGAEFGELSAYYTVGASEDKQSFTFTTPMTVIELQLDQGTVANASDVTKGISFIETSSKSDLGKIGFTYDIEDYDSFIGADYTVSVAFSVEIVGKVADYIEFNKTAAAEGPAMPDSAFSTSIGQFQFASGNSNKIECTLSSVEENNNWNFDVSTTEFTNKMLKFKDNKKPTSKGVYDTMEREISADPNCGIKFDVQVKIVSNS